ncbi:UNVERIFIED_CONTAM: hypothetical protein FKN15_007011 [Acipenser sinensis]
MALEDVVILVDTNTLETPFDDLQSLPNDVVVPFGFLCNPLTLHSHWNLGMLDFKGHCFS